MQRSAGLACVRLDHVLAGGYVPPEVEISWAVDSSHTRSLHTCARSRRCYRYPPSLLKAGIKVNCSVVTAPTPTIGSWEHPSVSDQTASRGATDGVLSSVVGEDQKETAVSGGGAGGEVL